MLVFVRRGGYKNPPLRTKTSIINQCARQHAINKHSAQASSRAQRAIMTRQQHLISFDWAIKRLLRSKANFSILEGFLSELLKRDLTIEEILESESNKRDKDGKSNRVDILTKLKSGELVLIEIQIDSEFDYLQRMLFGTSKIVSEYIDKGEPYAHVKKVYSINILYFDLGHGRDYIYHGTTSFTGMHQHDQLDLSEKQKEIYQKEYVHEIYPEYYLIKVNQFNDVAKDTLDEWIYFLKNDEIKDNFRAKGLLKAKEKLDELKLSPAERQAYRRYLNDLHYQASMAEYSDYGLAKREGKIEGEKIGIEKGKIEGEKIGAEKEKLKIAKAMKAAGMTSEAIAQVTGLSAGEITKIQTR